jgi:drug/metabolite transporter (DMT)-like permease
VKQPGERHRLLGHVAILTTVLLWGSLIPLLDILLAHFDVYALSAIRYGTAGILLLGGLVAIGGGAWLRRLPLGKVFLLGVCGICGFGTFYTLAIATTAPGMAIVVASATPAISAAFAAIAYRIPFEKGAGIAFLLAAIGAVTASLGRHGAQYSFDLRGGEALFVVAAICWAWYSINAQRWLADFSQLHLTAATMASAGIGVVLVFLVAAGFDAAHVPAWPSNAILALLVFITLGSTLTGVLCWNFAVARLGVIIASLYLNLLPVIGMITAAAIGRNPTVMQLVGGAIVIVGIAQLQLRRLKLVTQRSQGGRPQGLSAPAELSHTRREHQASTGGNEGHGGR